MTNAATFNESNSPIKRDFSGVTRLAPSPTGTLHLGNARTFLINWAMARQRGWKIILRIEDLDLTRVRPGAAEESIDQLRWLGIDWDEVPIHQSHDLHPYRDAMRVLCDARCAYASALTRKQVENAASAPHGREGETRFPPELRPPSTDHSAWRFDSEDMNYRFVVPDERVAIDDHLAGGSIHDPLNECGDFIIWTKLGVPAYQLAVVVDDARQGVTDVVRGDDLLSSAARQHLLYRALGLNAPNWWHLPLVVDANGHRLAKRRDDSHLASYRNAGAIPERVIGLIAAWSGIGDRNAPSAMSADEFRDRFREDMLPRQQIRFTEEDHQWLTRG